MHLKTDAFFGPFRFDVINHCLWDGSQQLLLRPKASAVLHVLVGHAGQLVTREVLLETVWPDTYVSDGALRFCLRELRKALKDTPQNPRFIETVHRRGYRFVAIVRSSRHTERTETVPLGDSDNDRNLLAQDHRRQQHTNANDPPRRNHHDTIGHLENGISLLQALPESPERTQQELTLRLALGAPLIAAKGHAASEVAALYSRARSLCHQAGETPHLFPVLWGLAINATVRGELRLAREVAERLRQLAQQSHDSSLMLEANFLYGSLLVWFGEAETGRVHLEQAVVLGSATSYTSHTFLYGHEPACVTRFMLSEALWLLGYPDQALTASQDALTIAQASNHLYSQVIVLNWATMLHLLRREPSLALAHAKTALTMAREQGFPHLEAVIVAFRGGACAALRDSTDGVVQIRNGLSSCRNMGAALAQPYLLAMLAEAYAGAGQIHEGLKAVDEGITRGRQTGEQWYEAELYRLKGELLLNEERGMRNDDQQRKGKPEDRVSIYPAVFITHRLQEADACFLKALHIARHQHAKSLELRAAVSLVRLRQQLAAKYARDSAERDAQKKLADAYLTLSAVYGEFTEGFDTVDLQEAKALLVSRDCYQRQNNSRTLVGTKRTYT